MDLSDLELADILLSTGSAAASVVIRAGTVSRYSHAALYIGNGQIIEAIGSGVTRQGIRDAMADDPGNASVARRPLTALVHDRIIAPMRGFLCILPLLALALSLGEVRCFVGIRPVLNRPRECHDVERLVGRARLVVAVRSVLCIRH